MTAFSVPRLSWTTVGKATRGISRSCGDFRAFTTLDNVARQAKVRDEGRGANASHV